MHFVKIMNKPRKSSKAIFLRRGEVSKSLQRYNLSVKLLLAVLFAFIFVLLVFSAEKAMKAFYSFKQIKQVLETDISNLKETLEFEKGKISLKIPRGNEVLLLTAYIDHNESVDFPRNFSSPYKIKGFRGELLSFPAGKEPTGGNWEEKLFASSNFLAVSADNIKIYENVKGGYFSKLNRAIDNTKFTALEVTFFQNQEVKGGSLFLKNPTGTFQAKVFSLLVGKNLGQFSGGILLENKDYKITSKNLEAKMKNGEVDELLFTEDVIFYQKGGEKTVVKGDNAFYNHAKAEIEIYGNVFIKSAKNNLWVKSENFIYSEKTKKGSFKAPKNRKVELEFEI